MKNPIDQFSLSNQLNKTNMDNIEPNYNNVDNAANEYITKAGGEYNRMYGHHARSFKAGALIAADTATMTRK